jgi:hypothetical protein
MLSPSGLDKQVLSQPDHGLRRKDLSLMIGGAAGYGGAAPDPENSRPHVTAALPAGTRSGDQVKTAVIVCFSWWLAAKAALVR